MEQTPSEQADGTRLNHDSCFCRSSTHKLSLALAIMVKKTLLQSRLAEGREGKGGQELSRVKECKPLLGDVPSSSLKQAGLGELSGIVCPANVIFTVSWNPVLSAVLL